MATPNRDEIATFMSITGASESRARRKLEEYGGSLNEAVNAHFGGGDFQITSPSVDSSEHNSLNSSNRSQSGQHGLLPFLSAARSFKLSLLFDPNYRRDLFNRIGAFGFIPRALLGSLPREARRDEQIHSQLTPNIENRTDNPQSHGWEPQRNTVMDNEGYAPLNASNLYDIDVEEEMIQAAINASKKDAEISSGSGFLEGQLNQEDDISHAVSLSLKTVEQEQELREQQMKVNDQDLGIYSRGKLKSGSSSRQGRTENVGEKSNHSAGTNDSSYCEEWGVISTKELDEAIMLESALFGDISERASARSSKDSNLHSGLGGSRGLSMQPANHYLSPNSGEQQRLREQRCLREQQDKEYHLSLLLDRQKEMNALNEAQTHRLKKEESKSKLLNKTESERSKQAAKRSSLPCEPALDDKNAVTLLIRMPNGSCLSRRFLQSDRLQCLFDFIDSSGAVEFGTYKLGRSYPRCPFGGNDCLLSLGELGLTNKQEALFLELI